MKQRYIQRLFTAVLAAAMILCGLSSKAQNRYVSVSSIEWDHNSTATRTFTVTPPPEAADDSLEVFITLPQGSRFSVSPDHASGRFFSLDVSVRPGTANTGYYDITNQLTVSFTTFSQPYCSETVSLTHHGAPRPIPEHDYAAGVSDDANYILVTTILSERDTLNCRRDITYYDGLGYLIQSQAVAASPQGRSIITPVVYDNMRRADARTLLPYVSASGSTGAFEANAEGLQSYYYWNGPIYGDSSPFAQKTFEPHAAGRVTSVLREGDAWHGANRRSTFEYGFNSAEDAVMKFSYNPSTSTVTRSGSYSAASLTKTTSTDEDGHTSVSFNTPRGKTLLSRQFSGSGSTGTASDTYFIYDLRDSLVCVIQPEGAAALAARSNATLTLKESASYANNDIYSAYCFSWKYDPWGNVLESHVPGGGTTEFTYDDRDRLVTEQTPRMKDLNLRRVMSYDECNRPTMERYQDTATGIFTATTHTWTYYPFSGEPAYPSNAGACGGLLRHERVYDAPSGDGPGAGYVDRYYHYDDRSRVIRVAEYDEDENPSEVTTTYDFVGNVISTTETQQQGGEFLTLRTEYTYDDRGRVTCMSRTLDDCPLADVFYSYDELGRLLTKTAGWGTLAEAYSYDIHSWKTGSTALVNGQTVFTQSLRYNAPLTGGHSGLYNGNISEGTVWYAGQTGLSANTAYTYDGLNRLTDASRPDHTERNILYDRNGNITGITRCGEGGTTPETITFSHDGNRLSSVSASAAYQYDSAGNLTYDPRKQLEFSYNVCNLPSSVRRDGEDSSLITYRYLSDGTKISAEAVLEPEIDEGDGYTPAKVYRRRYKGSFTYVTDPDTGEETLESIAWNEGMIFLRKMSNSSVPDGPVDFPEIDDGDIIVNPMDTLAVLDAGNRIIYDRWYVKDHLGNVRTVVELGSHVGEIVEQDDYLPFGTRFTPATQGVVCTADTGLYGSEHDNRYRYAGKEEQRFGPQIDLALLDFGARAYDPFTARWTSVDPLSHKYLGMSPYNYCGGNPVMYFDPDGKWAHVAVGAIIGAMVEGTVALYKGKTGSEFWGSVAKGAIAGGITAATAGFGSMVLTTEVCVNVIMGGVGGAAGSLAEQLITDGSVNESILIKEAVMGTAGGAISPLIKQGAKKILNESLAKLSSKYDPDSKMVEILTKEVEKEMKQWGFRLSGKAANNEFKRRLKDRIITHMKAEEFVVKAEVEVAEDVVNDAIQQILNNIFGNE